MKWSIFDYFFSCFISHFNFCLLLETLILVVVENVTSHFSSFINILQAWSFPSASIHFSRLLLFNHMTKNIRHWKIFCLIKGNENQYSVTCVISMLRHRTLLPVGSTHVFSPQMEAFNYRCIFCICCCWYLWTYYYHCHCHLPLYL